MLASREEMLRKLHVRDELYRRARRVFTLYEAGLSALVAQPDVLGLKGYVKLLQRFNRKAVRSRTRRICAQPTTSFA